MPVIILIFIVHIFLPTRLVFSVVLGTCLSIGYLGWVFALGHRSDIELAAIGVLVILCNVIGVITEWRRQVAGRRHSR